MRSVFSINGHPIHPALVSLPIGLFIWTFVADLAYLLTDRSPEWYDIAFWSGIAGVASALIAALPGFGDFIAVARHSSAKTTAVAHMLINVAVLGLYGTAALLMIDRNADDGAALGATIALHGMGAALLGVSGFLGGVLVYRHHIGMIPENSTVEHEEQIRHAAPTPIETLRTSRRAGGS